MLEGYEVRGVSRSAVLASVPDAGPGVTYSWRYDLGADPATIVWLDGGTSAAPTKQIEAGPRANQKVTVEYRTSDDGTDGNWTLVGVGTKWQHADAPSPATDLKLSVSAAGVFTLSWGVPATISAGHKIVRYGCKLWFEGRVEERLGKEIEGAESASDRERTTNPQTHAGEYYFEVNVISADADGNRYYADPAVSSKVTFAGRAVAVIDDTPFSLVGD